MKTFRVLWTGVICAAALPVALWADEEAVRQSLRGYVEAFNKQDVDGVAKAWAEDAEHVDRQTGERTTGRDVITADLAESFKTRSGMRLSGRVDHVRMIKPDVAAIDGVTTVNSPGEEPEESTFSGIVVQTEGRWVIQLLEESPVPSPADARDALRELEWLVGRWVDESETATVATSVRWSPSEAFLIRSFAVETDEGLDREGTQVIGWDPRAKQIRSWTFDSDGSFGDAVWTRTDDGWLIRSTQTLADGRAASGTYVFTMESHDELSVQLIGHEIEGEPQPAGPAIRVVRVADEPEPPATSEPEAAPPSDTTTSPAAGNAPAKGAAQ
jgi:uncharacterized protein (TIGR02246 family)